MSQQYSMWIAVLFAATLGLAPLPGRTQAAPETAVQFADTLARRYDVAPNLVYTTANNVELKLDLYYPGNAKEPVPLVLYFHGGGWVEGRKEAVVLGLMPYLQMGFAVANVGYRLGRVSPAPAAVEDARCALRWLTQRAKEYKIDTGKIVVTGGSAGGHLALMAGLPPAGNPFDHACATPGLARWTSGVEPPLSVAAVINYFGIADVEEILNGANAKHYAIEWFGAMPNREALARSLSPLQYVRAGGPAVFTVHGDADTLVPYSQSVRLHEALTKAGVANELVTISGGGHGGFAPADAARASAAMRAFLAKQGIVPVVPGK
ncbi:MAG: alpha/beta hydrolase [Betaproteobacteria bacterium]|nr:alpha/beta hydrolase [Betaproteobacteria bacterium]